MARKKGLDHSKVHKRTVNAAKRGGMITDGMVVTMTENGAGLATVLGSRLRVIALLSAMMHSKATFADIMTSSVEKWQREKKAQQQKEKLKSLRQEIKETPGADLSKPQRSGDSEVTGLEAGPENTQQMTWWQRLLNTLTPAKKES